MRLLLSSEGLVNKTIVQALADLLEKPFENSKLTFIPTAAMIEPGGKEWLINDLKNCQKLNFEEIDIVDISALEKEHWLPRIEKADVLLFGGGNAYYLMHWLIKSGLNQILPSLLKTRVYMGISAGSMVTTTNFFPTYNHDIEIYDEEKLSTEEIKNGLGLVNFHIIPHLNSPTFPKCRIEKIEQFGKKTKDAIYALDDNSAIKVKNDEITVVSEGTWKKFN